MKGTFVVGGAGFIGSHLVDVIAATEPVTVFDDFSVGRRSFLEGALATGRVAIVEGDARDLEVLTSAMEGHHRVIHLSANPEARWGLSNTRLDLEQGTIATYNVLEAMRRTGAKRIVFASSGTVYGEVHGTCSEGDLGALPISLYGASKLAGEGLVSAFAECFEIVATIVRFGNVVGPRATHGVIVDLLKKLARSAAELEVLGDGSQSKPYLHVSDCVRGVLFADQRATKGTAVFNLAPRSATAVDFIARACIAASPSPSAALRYTGGDRGWRGDVPRSRMDASKIEALGFALSHTSDEAVGRAVREIAGEVFGP